VNLYLPHRSCIKKATAKIGFTDIIKLVETKMRSKNPGYSCACPCHGNVTIHMTLTCDCGKEITPPQQHCEPPKRPKCPPLEPKPQPGTADVPQTPLPTFPTSNVPPWKEGRPAPGDPGEIPWFRGKVKEILRNGPTFGPRKDEFLPYLLVRAAAGDRGARQITGVFWESPDIFVVPNQNATTAPLMPPTLGGVAHANAPNTLYAHVWNLGKAPVYRVRVEFYWFNPSLGISRPNANLIGATWVDLANRFTLYPQWAQVNKSYGQWLGRGCHALVRCPETWFPIFQNGGHECLVVRAFDPIMDTVSPNEFSAANNRHVGQRNIAVVQAASPASIDLGLDLGYPDAPAEAEVDVSVDPPSSMEWLQLYSGARNPGLVPPTGPVLAGFSPPTAGGSRLPNLNQIPIECRAQLLKPHENFHRGCCPLQIAFHACAPDLRPHEAQVLRVRQRVDGTVVGGYSIVLVS
jgi:hypothetical protein